MFVYTSLQLFFALSYRLSNFHPSLGRRLGHLSDNRQLAYLVLVRLCTWVFTRLGSSSQGSRPWPRLFVECSLYCILFVFHVLLRFVILIILYGHIRVLCVRACLYGCVFICCLGKLKL